MEDDEIQTHSLDLHYTQIPIGKGQNKEVSQSARVPFSTISPFGELSCWIHSHAVKVLLLCHESSCAFQLMACAKCLNQHESSCAFQLAARAKCLNKTNAFTFRLIIRYFDLFIFSWDACQSTNAKIKAIRTKSNYALLFGGRSNKSFVGESVSDFQLVVDSKLILNSEEAHAVSITSYSFSEGAHAGSAIETNCNNFDESVSHRVDEKNEFRVNYVGNNPFQRTNLPFIINYFFISDSEGACAAQNLSSQLIVGSFNPETSFHFCNDCRIFHEGVKGARMTKPNGLFGRNLAFSHISAYDHKLAFCRIMAFGQIMAFGCNKLIELNNLAQQLWLHHSWLLHQ